LWIPRTVMTLWRRFIPSYLKLWLVFQQRVVVGFPTKGSRKLRFAIFVRFKCRTGIFNYVTVEFLILQFFFGHPLDTAVGCIESWRGIELD
jgi:hypothetical protein